MPIAPAYETQPASRRSVGRHDLRPGLPGHRQQPPVAVPRIPPVTIVMDALAQLLLTDRAGEELIEGPLVAREDHLHEEDEAPRAAREMAEKVGDKGLARGERVVVAHEEDVRALAGGEEILARQAAAVGSELAVEIEDVLATDVGIRAEEG